MLAISAISTLLALLFAAFTISHVLERFVMHGLDDRLDAQIAVLAREIRPDGSFDRSRAVDLPGFGESESGWSWQVDGPSGHWQSVAGSRRIMVAPPRPPGRRHPGADTGPRPGEGRGPGGEDLHSRTSIVTTSAGPVTITAVGPREIVEAPLRSAMIPLLGSLALLGIGLGLATLLQLRIGFRPLRALRISLAAIRNGTERHISEDQPAELQPLVTELNALIDQNAAGLAHARQHVANLAHGLKTPLAALSLRLAEAGATEEVRDMVDQIDRRVRHHLGRARADATAATRTQTPLAPAIADLVAVLQRLHADRAIQVSVDVPPDLAVAIDPQDLDEMIGNLLDNAMRHARTKVAISAVKNPRQTNLTIADDGDGLDDHAIDEAMVPGRRLDERGDGHGFGLSITRELAELNGGTLALARSPDLGGLLACLILRVRS